jgi:hypothetical protein
VSVEEAAGGELSVEEAGQLLFIPLSASQFVLVVVVVLFVGWMIEAVCGS